MACRVTAVSLAVALLIPSPGSAHHSFAADFDATKPVNLTGTLARMEWTNPHAHVHLDVVEAGVVKSWKIEMATPSVLMRGGWRKESVKVGDTLTVNGYAAKNGALFATARSVTTRDGQLLFTRAGPK